MLEKYLKENDGKLPNLIYKFNLHIHKSLQTLMRLNTEIYTGDIMVNILETKDKENILNAPKEK